MDDGTEAAPVDDGPDWADDSTPLLPEDCRERSVDFFFGRSSCCIVRTMSHERQCGPRSPQADKGTEGEMSRGARETEKQQGRPVSRPPSSPASAAVAPCPCHPSCPGPQARHSLLLPPPGSQRSLQSDSRVDPAEYLIHES